MKNYIKKIVKGMFRDNELDEELENYYVPCKECGLMIARYRAQEVEVGRYIHYYCKKHSKPYNKVIEYYKGDDLHKEYYIIGTDIRVNEKGKKYEM